MKTPPRFLRTFAFLLVLAAPLRAASPFTPDELRYRQNIGARLPLDTPLVDESGNAVPLGKFFTSQPVVLVFGYLNCPQLCSVVANGVIETLRPLEPSVNRDYQVVFISIDPTDTQIAAARRREQDASRYGRTGAIAGWHYLTGPEAAVRRVAEIAGFRYAYDPATRQYAHPSGFVVVTPHGVVSRYFLGVDFPPADVAAALRRAAENGTGTSVYDLLLLCFHGDGITGRYGKLIWTALWIAVAGTVGALAGGIGWMLYREHRPTHRLKSEGAP